MQHSKTKRFSAYWVALSFILALSTILFAALAVRNAHVLDCQSFETDDIGNSYCRIWIGWESPEE